MATLGDASAPGVNGLIQQFTAITGATESVGKHMLEACNNNLEMAVTMFLDGGGIAEEPSTSASSAGASGSRHPPEEDDVRAPIPQKQDILVEPEPLFGVPKRRRPARSIFDGFRDFQTETMRQEQELRNGSAVDKKLSTLADLFRPPIELMHKGSFETAKDSGQLENKWLMINIQNVQDFACQCLNRDVWSNDAVKNIIREHFIFWQVYHDSEEGQRYIQFYKLNKFPYISILDPRTGQKMVEWNQLDVTSFLDQVTGFLSEHGQLDGQSSQPPAKRARSESLIDASEDSQLEAAIRASLQETHYESTQDEAESRSDDEESDAEPFSDSEGLISVDGSDNEAVGGEDSLDGHVSAEVAPPTRPDSPAHHRKSPHKELCHRKEESKKNHLDPVGLSHSQTGQTESQQRLGENHRSTSHLPSEPAGTSTADPDDNGPKARLMLRYPDGQKRTDSTAASETRSVQGDSPMNASNLSPTSPAEDFAHLDYDIHTAGRRTVSAGDCVVQERN
ncbi:UBX domain-containing protein 7 [Carassius auratus]|uniref:UBX domain-containing protein 7 n=1 Tax=Carassius auratus TaxID=7957 RepID=A0A6P6JT99_CARAU|nr:UBX domain-containing protein 7-like [Carassius auratus]